MHRIILSLAILLATLSLSHAQTLMPARQVSADTNGWVHIDPGTPTAQSSFNWIDENWPGIDTSAWTYMPSTAATTQVTFNWLDGWLTTYGPNLEDLSAGYGATGFLPGTNITGAAFDEETGTWEIDSLLPGTNITYAGGTAEYDTNTHTWVISPGSQEFSEYFSPVFLNRTNITTGAAGEYNPVTSYTVVFTNSPWAFDDNTGILTIPVDGVYIVRARIASQPQPNNRNTVRPLVRYGGTGDWYSVTALTGNVNLGSEVGIPISTAQGASIAPFSQGDQLLLTYTSTSTLSSTNRIRYVTMNVGLVHPLPEGANFWQYYTEVEPE